MPATVMMMVMAHIERNHRTAQLMQSDEVHYQESYYGTNGVGDADVDFKGAILGDGDL